MDHLLENAKSLYRERQKIALATLLVVFSAALYIFYSPDIYEIESLPQEWFPPGWSQGFEVVYSFNTIGFIVAFALMIFGYAFWTWAFLPTPAANYTDAVLNGVFGPYAKISHSIGKRFKVEIGEGKEINITCRIKEQGSDEWFVYRLESPYLHHPDLKNIALRHGMSEKDGKLVTWISNDELHGRSVLMARAVSIASS